ncbi:MAG: DUF134 domain-containing protein [Patescibacteria group bacterium]|jgi:predicted DNA-binding protein (UPF0251 family)
MSRPRLNRRVSFDPQVRCFKPCGVPMTELQMVELSREEVETYRLRYIDNLEQKAAAKQMETSQSTYQRILISAHKKISDALVNGKAIKIIY